MDKDSKYLCEGLRLPNTASYNDLVASGDWVEMYGESNLVSKQNHDHILVLHEGVWRIVILD